MSCKGARRQMVLADSLTADEAEALQEHIHHCPECARRWQQWERLRAWLANLPKVTPSSEDRQQFMAHLMAQAPSSPTPVWDCPTTRQHLWLWLDGELSREQRFSLIAHLAGCDRCQAALWEAEQTLRLLRGLPKVTATAAEKAAVRAKLFRQPTRKAVVPFVWRLAVPFAAAAIVTLLVITYRFTKPSTTVIVGKPTPPAPSAPRFAQKSQTSPLPIQSPKERSVAEKPTGQQKRAPEKQLVGQPMMPKLAVAPTVKPHPTKREPLVAQRKVEPAGVFSPPPSTPQPMPAQPLTEVPTPPTLPEPTIATPSPPPAEPSPPQEPTVVAAEPSPSLPGSQLSTPSPIPSSMESEPRRLVSLPPVTIERDEPPLPRLQLSVIPPSQQLYRKFGVALTTVPADKKRPLRVNEPLPQETSIPLAAERYRSRTALISLWQIGISW